MTTATAQRTAATPTYVDVAAVRIQSYLARSRHLWGRRGASSILAKITHEDEVAALAVQLSDQFGFGVHPAPDAPDVDGVISLIVDAGERARDVALAVARHMGEKLPGLHLEGSWATAATHVDANVEMRRTSAPVQWLAPVMEFPPALRCGECGADTATQIVQRGKADSDEKLALCRDCVVRSELTLPRRGKAVVDVDPLTRATESNKVGQFTAEARLLGEFNADAVADFDALARLGRDKRRNHLATICADGNRIGELFEHARTACKDLPGEERAARLKALSGSVKATTWAALVVATNTIYDPGMDEALPVIVHVLGGDDVLVSVPADRTWPFIRALMSTFRDGDATGAARTMGLIPPTLSAGVVISGSSQPFGRSVEVATALLGAAKRAVCGGDFSVAWLDVTSDGIDPLPTRRPWTLDRLATCHPALLRLAATGQSARQSLLRDIDTDEVTLAQQRLRARLGRQDQDVREAVTGYLDAMDPKDPTLLSDPKRAGECVRALRDGISLARWWQ